MDEFDARASALLEYIEAAIQALSNARRLVLESAVGGADGLPDLPDTEPDR